MGKAKKGKNRLDKFYHLAKEQGYRSRAAFKLLQLDAKFRFLPTARSVLDLCAAPGGWLQVAVRHAPVGSFILGVDLVPIRPIRGAHTIAEDITTPRCRAAIKRLMDSNGVALFDVVLHDGSPNVGAAWGKDATMQSALVVDSIRLVTSFLGPKGIFLTKVFRSQDYSAILFCLKQLFEKVEVTKPVASRSTSAEIYVIGQRYKAPAKIDPRLLDVKHLFHASAEQPKVIDVLRGTKQKRNREGYEDGITTLWKVGKVSDFIWSDSPLEFLGSVNALSFEDSSSLSIKEHDLTTEEIKSLCEDLYVLDKNSFKHLLKWRMHIRKALSSSDKDASKVEKVEKDTKGDEDERLLVEMEELTKAVERKKKKAKKLLEKRRAKDKARKALGIQIDATEDSYFDKHLFSLTAIKGKKELQTIESASDEDGELGGSESEAEPRAAADSSDLDSDEERRQYDEQVEEMLDEVYERYLSRRGGSTKQRKRAKRDISIGDAELMENADGEDAAMDPDSDQDQDQGGKERNPLVIPLNEDDHPTQEQIMEQWFSQDVFAAAVEEGVLEASDSEDEKIVPPKILNKPISKKPVDRALYPKDHNPPQSQKANQQEDFEIVPQDRTDTSDDSSSDDESEEEDDGTKAEILAYAKKMLRKKQREQILDDAYNKYMFDDVGLPSWFAEEEKRHSQPLKPVTKEEIAAMRAQFREIDARPAKKVAEAKARKKRAAMKKLEKARKKADVISDQTDISERSKRKMIDHLYKKATPTRPKKEYVVAKKGVPVKGGKGKVVVDRRMKKDKRTKGMGRPGRGGRPVKEKGPKAKGKGSKGKPLGKNGGKKGKKAGMRD